MADPTGKRPVPRIPKGKSTPSGTTDPYGGIPQGGSSNTKTPTGSRPMPTIPRHTPEHAAVPGPVKRPIKHTPMPTPNEDRLTGASKPEGGGSY